MSLGENCFPRHQKAADDKPFQPAKQFDWEFVVHGVETISEPLIIESGIRNEKRAANGN